MFSDSLDRNVIKGVCFCISLKRLLLDVLKRSKSSERMEFCVELTFLLKYSNTEKE